MPGQPGAGGRAGAGGQQRAAPSSRALGRVALWARRGAPRACSGAGTKARAPQGRRRAPSPCPLEAQAGGGYPDRFVGNSTAPRGLAHRGRGRQRGTAGTWTWRPRAPGPCRPCLSTPPLVPCLDGMHPPQAPTFCAFLCHCAGQEQCRILAPREPEAKPPESLSLGSPLALRLEQFRPLAPAGWPPAWRLQTSPSVGPLSHPTAVVSHFTEIGSSFAGTRLTERGDRPLNFLP